MSDKGWIKLYRQILDCDLWIGFDNEEPEPFDKRSAWIDLLLRANHSDKQMIFNYEPITVTRGQLITSVRKLSARWGWCVTKTYKYLSLLETLGMIEKQSDRQKTLITLVNYSVYQSDGNTNETQTKHKQNTNETRNGHKQEYKELKNERSIYIQQVVDAYNAVCVSLPKVQKLTDARKRAIASRLNKYTIEDFSRLFEMVEQSDFLTGRSGNWQCSFDWLLKEANIIKVLEGNYSNKDKPQPKPKQNKFNTFPQNAYDFEALERELVNK